MIDAQQMKDMAEQIAVLRKAASRLKEMASGSFPAVEKNADRILASVRMLELNVTDVVELTSSS